MMGNPKTVPLFLWKPHVRFKSYGLRDYCSRVDVVAFLKVCDPVFCRVPDVPDFGIGLRCPTDLHGDYMWMTR